MSVLLSIKPEFVEKIFAGEKRFEFRRALPAEEPRRVVVYASSPVQRIVGEFRVRRVLSTTPEALWRRTRKHAGIERDYFERYFEGRQLAHALEIEMTTRYRRPLNPWQSVEAFFPPQSFMYLRTLQSRGLSLPFAA